MALIDVASIINGTKDKAFSVAYSSMIKYYSKETAAVLYRVYADASLSFIMSHAYEIIKEAYFGLGFMKNLINSTILLPESYLRISNVTCEIVEDAKRNFIPREQIAKYEEIGEFVKKKFSLIENTSKILEHNTYNTSNGLVSTMYLDVLYDIEKANDKNGFKSLISMLHDIESPVAFFAIAGQLLSKYPTYVGSTVYDITKKFYGSYSIDMDDEAFKNRMKTIICLGFICKDQYAHDALKSCNNMNLQKLWEDISVDSIEKYESRRVKEVAEKNHYTYTSVNDTAELQTLLLQESTEKNLMQDKVDLLHYKSLNQKKLIIESVVDRSIEYPDEYPMSEAVLDKYIQQQSDIEAEMIALEWEDTGEPNAVIKQHIMTQKQIKKESDDLTKEKNISAKEMNSDQKKDDTKDDDEPEDNDDSDSKDNEDDTEESVDDFVANPFSSLYQEQDSDDIPQKPKEELIDKIQNKAMDHDVNRKEKQAERNLKMTKLKNASKAVTAGPQGWIKSADNFTKEFDKMDENRRKKFFMKPGYRHRIFKNFKLALLYGSVAKMNIFWLPITQLLRHFSKDKDRRVRNELSRELETEIKICDEKINDANSNGDQQEKYKLMRIKDKLEAERQRVSLNSKYI